MLVEMLCLYQLLFLEHDAGLEGKTLVGNLFVEEHIMQNGGVTNDQSLQA